VTGELAGSKDPAGLKGNEQSAFTALSVPGEQDGTFLIRGAGDWSFLVTCEEDVTRS